jgi:hypothetical protein
MPEIRDEFKPGSIVRASGIYRVTHDNGHAKPHDVTCIAGRKFPTCKGCEHPRFKLLKRAQHVGDNTSFA